MICADRDITIFNKFTDPETRRTAYRPTLINGCSLYDRHETSKNGGFHSGQSDYSVRIPYDAEIQDGRIYESAVFYDADEQAGEHWTIHTEDYIVVWEDEGLEIANSVFEPDIIALAKQHGYQGLAIQIDDYADNTRRGSDRVKHWRIGGA